VAPGRPPEPRRAGIVPPSAALRGPDAPVDTSRLPNFFLLGAPKAGTTSFHGYLKQHPQIFLPYVKEVGFFQIDDEYRRGLAYLVNSYYRTAHGYPARGDASQMYFGNVFAADRIRVVLPESSHRFIVLLRDPVDRAYSNYLDMVRQRVEAVSFERGLELEPERLRADPLQSGAFGYVTNSRYAERLRPWIERFGRDRFLILFFDDLLSDLRAVMHVTCAFLGIDDVLEPHEMPLLNSAGGYRFGVLPWLWSAPPWVKRALSTLVDARRRAAIMQFIGGLDARPSGGPPLADDTVRRLRELFADDVTELECLTGRDLAAWRQTTVL
jgi:hypothetical protein